MARAVVAVAMAAALLALATSSPTSPALASAHTGVNVVAEGDAAAVVQMQVTGEDGVAGSQFSFSTSADDKVLRLNEGPPYDGSDAAKELVRLEVDGATVRIPGDLRLGTQGISVEDEIAALRTRVESLEQLLNIVGRPGTHSNPARNCSREALGDDAVSGMYWVSPDAHLGATANIFIAQCDLDNDGGGWMLVARQAPHSAVDVYFEDFEFHYGGSAWVSGEGRGAVSDPGASHVSAAWNHVAGAKEARFKTPDNTGIMDISSCVGSGTLADASGSCGALPAYIITACGGASRCSDLYFNQRSLTAVCDIESRIYLGTAIWDNGDSEVVIGLGYNYMVGNQHSASCQCPYSNYCGANLANGGTFPDGLEVWVR